MSKKAIIGIVIIVILGAVLFFMKSGKNKPVDIDQVSGSPTGGVNLGNDFVIALVGVQKISLDTKFLKNPAFQSLESSGALIDRMPLRGKNDPFSKSITEETKPVQENTTNPRLEVLGKPNPTINAFIKVSKITSSVATISITGIPEGEFIIADLKTTTGQAIELSDFTYKIATGEYTSTVTSLNSKTIYTVTIKEPVIYVGLQTQFETK